MISITKENLFQAKSSNLFCRDCKTYLRVNQVLRKEGEDKVLYSCSIYYCNRCNVYYFKFKKEGKK